METATDIAPSPEARHLFNKMVRYAGEDLMLTLTQTLALGCELVRDGSINPRDCSEVGELQACAWIVRAADGGWNLN
jgi:hypothetical protein